jgi:tetratricopeptide (TPR) repeat protein
VLAAIRLAPIASDEAVDWLPAALAAAGSRTQFDTLLLRYGAALEEAGNCGEALGAYESVIRRRADSARRSAATRGVARCGLALGATALRSSDAIAADRWFTRVAAVDPGSGAGRRALIGLGDARVAQGDTIAAVIAWQRAADAGRSGDSIGVMAARRIRAAAGTNRAGDTTRVRE